MAEVIDITSALILRTMGVPRDVTVKHRVVPMEVATAAQRLRAYGCAPVPALETALDEYRRGGA